MTDTNQRPPLEGASTGMLNLGNSDPIQMGFWVPNRTWATAKFLVPLRKHIEAKKKAGQLDELTPVVQAFKDWVTANSTYRMWLNYMIQQANYYVIGLKVWDEEAAEQIKDEDGDTLWLKGYDQFFEVLNEIITTSPAFNNTAMVGTPMNGYLAVAMGTPAGAALFHDRTFNEHFKKVLDAWNTFLKSSASLDKLDIKHPEKPGSWISKAAWEAGVWKDMVKHPLQQGYGYDSWNSFFIRQFEPNKRPFHGNPETDINIGCETTPWEYRKDLQLESNFWSKDVRYSLLDIFGGNQGFAEKFVGGQLYQGFLSATHYHRWNAPITGKIVRSWVEPGTYFAQNPTQGENPGTWEGTQSQPYLAHVAARAVFLFEHETFGYVALICIGMVEVSTCVIDPGCLVGEDHPPVAVQRGAEIGHFEFGGSTHMMLFQKDRVVLEEWARDAQSHRNDPNPIPLGTVIASIPK